jgi:hypothetical protein
MRDDAGGLTVRSNEASRGRCSNARDRGVGSTVSSGVRQLGIARQRYQPRQRFVGIQLLLDKIQHGQIASILIDSRVEDSVVRVESPGSQPHQDAAPDTSARFSAACVRRNRRAHTSEDCTDRDAKALGRQNRQSVDKCLSGQARGFANCRSECGPVGDTGSKSSTGIGSSPAATGLTVRRPKTSRQANLCSRSPDMVL